MIETDILRTLAGTSVLAFAAVADLRWRRAPDLAWVVLAVVGVALLAWDWLAVPDFWATNQALLVTAGLIFVLAVVGYFTGLITGGADAKALAALALLWPVPLGPEWTVPLASPFPLVLTTLTNALLVALAVPVLLTLNNLARGDVQGLHTFVSLKRPVDGVDLRVTWPLEYMDDEGAHHLVLTPRGVPLDAFDPAALTAAGHERIWVTPKVPFLVPLWVGLVLAVLVGDPVGAGLDVILSP